MSLKSTKSYLKRFKITKNGKILSRKAGQNHFNAKERTRTSTGKRRLQAIYMNNKAKSRFLPTI
ncbi:MAG: 50S ribosomal protein L35 [Patescibacteria group bacterium]|nr:50S ribosomal protein L35 [Patescibacteria group bacterium]MDE2172783.1 50S ribosomal protein L35 [Patescibacteria group bacterium]